MKQKRTTLAVDLAHRDYGDVGFAFLDAGATAVQFLQPNDLGLTNPPDAETFAAALDVFSRENHVGALLLDGPQGWKSDDTGIEHMRLCERVLNTPGRTGPPGTTKPGTYLPFISFSIDVFHHLRTRHGWSLLTEDWGRRRRRWIVECFPTSAWKTMGLEKLPAKSKSTRKAIDANRKDLKRVTGWTIPARPTHDQLQAAVLLPLGEILLDKQPDRLVLSGMDPIIRDDVVLEGWIANPTPQGL